MQNEEMIKISTPMIHCQSTNQEVGPRGIHLAKQNKKALQPESSTELQDDKHTVTQTQTAASSFEATVSIDF